MAYSELSERNFKRICLINWSLTLPTVVFLAWPYYLLATWIGISKTTSFIGAFAFAVPFMWTILHGHVTMALGAMHRQHYYEWLGRNSLTYGFLFHPVMFRTRFRISFVILSLLLLIVAVISRL